MAVHLSRLAKYYVADFLNYRDVLVLPGDWCAMFEVFDSGSAQRHRMPLPEYAVTKEFDLGLRTGVLPTKVEYLFNGGPGATFWYRVPAGFISAIVQSFLRQSTKTAVRPVVCVRDCSTLEETLLWQELYVDFFPCVRCQRTQLGEDPSEELPARERPANFYDPNGKGSLYRVKIYAGGCANPVPTTPPQAPRLRRPLLAELMLEAYRFLDRYSLDVSQLVCSEWQGSIERSSQQLALYSLSAWFTHADLEREQDRQYDHFRGVPVDHEWHATFANYADCFDEIYVRTFHFLNAQPPEPPP